MDDGGEGKLAATLFLGTGRAEGALAVDLADPAMKALAEEQDALEQQIAALRLKKELDGPGAVRRAAREAADRAGAEDQGDPRSAGQEGRKR